MAKRAQNESLPRTMRIDFMNKLRAYASRKLQLSARALQSYAGRLRLLADRLRPYAIGKMRLGIERLRPYVDRLRAYAARLSDELRPYLDRLRPYFARLSDKLRPYIERLRPYAIRLRGYAEKALEPIRRWIRRYGALRVGAAALGVLLVLGIGFAAIFPESAGRYARAMLTSSRVVPLPDGIRTAAREKAKELAAALDRRVDKKRRLAGEAWTSARILVALRENNPDYASRVDIKAIERYFRSVAGPECACWRQLPRGRYPYHLGVTSWVLWTLAGYGIPAHKSELEFLLSTQDREGGWPLFAGAKHEQFASSYGTAAAILALHEQSGLEADPERKKRIAAAVQRGADWLKSRAAGRARWADYPAWPEAKEEFLGVSGFVLFALHRAGATGLGALDRDWLRRLPPEAPAAPAADASGKSVQVGNRSYPDETRYFELPWSILATVHAYPGAWIWGKVHAIEWLERALGPKASIYRLNGKEKNPVLAAEALLALRSNGEARRD